MLAAAIAVAVLMLTVWLVAGAVRDVSIVDLFWGPAFVLAAWTARLTGEDAGGAAGTLALVCVTLWGLRLGAHIARRNLGHGEDPRYAAMRARRPDTFWRRSLLTVFALQGALVLLVGWPVIAAAGRDAGDIGVLGLAGASIFAVGLFFEAVGDLQLARFKADPANRGQVMDRGLWRYTRHPNYFGDATVWAGLWLVALDAGVTPLTVVSPIVMTYLIVNVSGVRMLERHMAQREKYADYIARTSVFVPRPPRQTS